MMADLIQLPTFNPEALFGIKNGKVVIHQTESKFRYTSPTEISQSKLDATQMEETGISVYPNPISDKATFRGLDRSGGNVIIYNIIGQKVWYADQINAKPKMEIDLSSFTNGVYLVNFVANNSVATKKINFIK